MRNVPAVLFLAAVMTACRPKAPETAVNLPAPAAAATTATATGDEITGPLQEQLSAPPYTYLRIKTAKGDVWAAVPDTKLEAGATVTVKNPLRMTNFESKTLKRTFDEVWFGTLPSTAASAGTMPAMPPQNTAQVVVGKVEKATGADAHTVAEVWAQREQLAGKSVTIRGVVVKYTAEVMSKNWIHLQDGSGDPAKGTNDITVTSLDVSAKGNTVTVTGTVRINKDFGAGYSYAVLLEEAKVVRQ